MPATPALKLRREHCHLRPTWVQSKTWKGGSGVRNLVTLPFWHPLITPAERQGFPGSWASWLAGPEGASELWVMRNLGK